MLDNWELNEKKKKALKEKKKYMILATLILIGSVLWELRHVIS